MSDLYNWFCGTTREYVASLGSVPKGADGVSGADKLAPTLKVCNAEVYSSEKPIESGRDAANQNSRPCADSQVSASIPSAPGAELDAGREGTVAASPAVPSFQGLTIERLISDVERIANETK